VGGGGGGGRGGGGGGGGGGGVGGGGGGGARPVPACVCLLAACAQVALIKEGATRTIGFLRAEVDRMKAECDERVSGVRKEMENLNVRARSCAPRRGGWGGGGADVPFRALSHARRLGTSSK
jgi:hypothetical protein